MRSGDASVVSIHQGRSMTARAAGILKARSPDPMPGLDTTARPATTDKNFSARPVTFAAGASNLQS
jgi:hypothetical protein